MKLNASENVFSPHATPRLPTAELTWREMLNFRRRDAAMLLPFIPFILLVWFVYKYGVNVPIMDQWGLAYFFHGVKTGWATLDDWVKPNNEHRIFFPKLIWIVLAFATKWNIRYELFTDVGFAFLTLVAFAKLAWRQKDRVPAWFFHLSLFLTSLLVFSLAQWENWLWGYQLSFILVQTCVAWAIAVAFLPVVSFRKRMTVAAMLCIVASFSSAQGLFSWPALVPVVGSAPERAGKRTVDLLRWLGLFALCAGVYSIHFHRDRYATLPDTTYFLTHPWNAVWFFLGLCGAQFAHGTFHDPPQAAPLIGLAMLVCFLCFVVWALRKKLFPQFAPWISTALFALFFAVLTTIGRSAWGLAAGVNSSRYTTPMVFLSVALVQMGVLLCHTADPAECATSTAQPAFGSQVVHRPTKWSQALYGCASICVIGLVVFNSADAIRLGWLSKLERERCRRLLPLLQYIDPSTDGSTLSCIFPLFPVAGHTSWVRTPAAMLDQIGFRPMARNLAFEENPSDVYGVFEPISPTESAHGFSGADVITASGWATIPHSKNLPKLVLISHDDSRIFITAAMVGLKRPDVAAVFNSSHYLHAGWQVQVPASFLPVGKSVLKAWVYDEADGKFVKLGDIGDKSINTSR